MRVALIDARGHIWAEDRQEPHGGISHTDEWSRAHEFGDQYTLPLPSTMPPGDYQLSIAVQDLATAKHLSAITPTSPRGDSATLATVHIEKDKSNILASTLIAELVRDGKSPYVQYVDLQDVRFFGHYLSRATASPGEQVQIGLLWRARAKPRGDYLVSVQLRDPDYRVALDQASRPAAGEYPTTQWAEGEVLLDWHSLAIPNSLAPGEYQIYVGLRDAVTQNPLGEARIGMVTVAP
jgi:hypothetical protein